VEERNGSFIHETIGCKSKKTCPATIHLDDLKVQVGTADHDPKIRREKGGVGHNLLKVMRAPVDLMPLGGKKISQNQIEKGIVVLREKEDLALYPWVEQQPSQKVPTLQLTAKSTSSSRTSNKRRHEGYSCREDRRNSLPFTQGPAEW